MEQRSSKLAHGGDRLVSPGCRHVILEQLRQCREQVEVRAYLFLDSVVLDFDNDQLARG